MSARGEPVKVRPIELDAARDAHRRFVEARKIRLRAAVQKAVEAAE